jgi:hypothetical protein
MCLQDRGEQFVRRPYPWTERDLLVPVKNDVLQEEQDEPVVEHFARRWCQAWREVRSLSFPLRFERDEPKG